MVGGLRRPDWAITDHRIRQGTRAWLRSNAFKVLGTHGDCCHRNLCAFFCLVTDKMRLTVDPFDEQFEDEYISDTYITRRIPISLPGLFDDVTILSRIWMPCLNKCFTSVVMRRRVDDFDSSEYRVEHH